MARVFSRMVTLTKSVKSEYGERGKGTRCEFNVVTQLVKTYVHDLLCFASHNAIELVRLRRIRPSYS